MEIQKSKKTLIFLGILLSGIAILSFFFWIYFIKPKSVKYLPPEEKKELPKEKTLDEILKDLTAPSDKEKISEAEKENILKNLTSPKEEKTSKEEIEKRLENLNAPQ